LWCEQSFQGDYNAPPRNRKGKDSGMIFRPVESLGAENEKRRRSGMALGIFFGDKAQKTCFPTTCSFFMVESLHEKQFLWGQT
jgi:hypothetical protein